MPRRSAMVRAVTENETRNTERYAGPCVFLDVWKIGEHVVRPFEVRKRGRMTSGDTLELLPAARG